MKKIFRLVLAVILMPAAALASQFPDHSNGQDEKPLAAPPEPNPSAQAALRHTAAWQQFENSNGNWYVVFDEATSIPSRAYGSPVQVPLNTDNVTRARYFLSHALSSYAIPVKNLELLSDVSTSKYTYIKFYQQYKGLKILNSKAQVRFNANGDVVLFQLSIFPDAEATTTPAFGEDAIADHLQKFFSMTVKRFETAGGLALLSVSTGEENSLRLIYQLKVTTEGSEGMDGIYKVFLDAETGEVHYSQSLVHNANSSVDLTATVYKSNPLTAAEELPVQYAEVQINGTTYYTDENGHLDIDLSSATQAEIRLAGKWSTVYQGNSSNKITSFTTTLQPGSNVISFDNDATVRQLSAYYHVNQIHEFLKKTLPTFDGMDFSLETRVDRTDGSCNAFYNGNSINFYTASNGCQAFSLVGDVIYHEYGHGINYEFYDWLGEDFENRALGEGYADVWALALTHNPVLGLGRNLNGTGYVRRYDVNPKVYPQDLTGEVHDDGEIIAGAWWDLGVNLDSVEQMFEIFIEAYYATPNAFSGDEGKLYHDILLDALMADDDDGDLVNGSPHDSEIIDAFAKHGITLLSQSELTHEEILLAKANTDITVEAELETSFNVYVKGMDLFYAVNGSSWTSTEMENTSGDMYTASIPAQPKGSIINYYIRLMDTYDNVARVLPLEADFVNPNIPYQILVGYSRFHIEDFDDHEGDWTVGISTDDAAKGQWEIGFPKASYIDLSNPSSNSRVQTGSDHTTGFGRCAVTGNSTSISTASLYDVDAGLTTLISPVFDLTPYQDPVISYYRWYTNRQGSNPGNDFFEVAISDDGGASWRNVENTNVPDKSWRRFAFKVKDYATDMRTVQVRFIASDKMVSGQSNGQSLVEAAIDDLEILDTKTPDGISENTTVMSALRVFPNPATGKVQVMFDPTMDGGTIRLLSVSGQVMQEMMLQSGNQGLQEINVAQLPAGMYLVEVSDGAYFQRAKLSITR